MVKRLAYWLWPPYEAIKAHQEIDKRNREIGDDARWNSILTELRNSLPKDETKCKDIEIIALQVQEAEIKRKETLENKASTFVSFIGVSVSIISVIPVLFVDKWNIPTDWAIIASIAYLVSIILFFVAGYYAIQVRRVAGFALPCAGTFIEAMKQNQGDIRERIVLTIAQTKWNEVLLTKKANFLSVVEDLFLRGLAIIAFAAIVSISAKLLFN